MSASEKVDIVAGIGQGLHHYAPAVALRAMNAGFVADSSNPNKLPAATTRRSYGLEYETGAIEISLGCYYSQSKSTDCRRCINYRVPFLTCPIGRRLFGRSEASVRLALIIRAGCHLKGPKGCRTMDRSHCCVPRDVGSSQML